MKVSFQREMICLDASQIFLTTIKKGKDVRNRSVNKNTIFGLVGSCLKIALCFVIIFSKVKKDTANAGWGMSYTNPASW